MLTGAYKVGAYRAAGHFRLTNKTPAATYRAPGRFEGSFVRERVMDALAAKLGIDRIALRRANLIPAAEMPYTITFNEKGAEELPLDSGDFVGLFDKALAHFRWREVEAAAAARRARGRMRRHRGRVLFGGSRARPARQRAHFRRHLRRASRSSPAARRSARASRR